MLKTVGKVTLTLMLLNHWNTQLLLLMKIKITLQRKTKPSDTLLEANSTQISTWINHFIIILFYDCFLRYTYIFFKLNSSHPSHEWCHMRSTTQCANKDRPLTSTTTSLHLTKRRDIWLDNSSTWSKIAFVS